MIQNLQANFQPFSIHNNSGFENQNNPNPQPSSQLKLKLRVFNLVMGLIHLVQAAAIFYLAGTHSFTLTASYLEYEKIGGLIYPETFAAGSIPLGLALAGVSLISGTFHLLVAGPFFFNKYVLGLSKNYNFFRWIEYALSSSLMIVIIAVLMGIFDIHILILMYSLCVCMIAFGGLSEYVFKFGEGLAKICFWLGALVSAVVWVIIFNHYYSLLKLDYQTPGYLAALIISTFVLFNIFAVNMYLKLNEYGPWKNYYFVESMFILLSLTAKSALIWQVYVGAIL